MSNPFTYAANKVLPGFGGASVQENLSAALTATATKTLTVSPGCHSGFLHVGLQSPNAATTCQIQVTVDDGTTTTDVFAKSAASTAGDDVDYLIPILTDIAFTTISVIYTLAGATTTGTANLDFAGNP